MKTYIADFIPKLQRFSKNLDNLTLLTNQHWVVVDEITTSKTVYIFRHNNELIISRNGLVEKGKWEFLGTDALLIEIKQGSYLFRHGFFDENIMALKVDGKEEYAFLVNETKGDKDLNSPDRILDFLEKKYLTLDERNKVRKELGLPPVEEPVFIPVPVVEKTPEEIAEEERLIVIKKINQIKRQIREYNIRFIICLSISIPLIFFITILDFGFVAFLVITSFGFMFTAIFSKISIRRFKRELSQLERRR